MIASLAEGGKKIDLILCDSVMPVMEGPAAVKLMREHGFTGPILGCTGNTLQKDVEDFIAHGVNSVMGKPVKKESLKNFMITFGLALASSSRVQPAKVPSESKVEHEQQAAGGKGTELVPSVLEQPRGQEPNHCIAMVEPATAPTLTVPSEGVQSTQAPSPTKAKIHVLVVEDSQICRTMLKKLLGTLKCTVEEAEVRLTHFRRLLVVCLSCTLIIFYFHISYIHRTVRKD